MSPKAAAPPNQGVGLEGLWLARPIGTSALRFGEWRGLGMRGPNLNVTQGRVFDLWGPVVGVTSWVPTRPGEMDAPTCGRP